MATRIVKESPGVLIARATDQKRECVVHSSNGDFLIYPDGRVKLWEPDPVLNTNNDKTRVTLEHYLRIVRFNAVK